MNGLVDLGKFTPDSGKHAPCDHVAGSWHQILGVFTSRGNVNAALLSKILLEAVLVAEEASLKVDYMVADGAPMESLSVALFRDTSGSSASVR